jgi:hypothetical protein
MGLRIGRGGGSVRFSRVRDFDFLGVDFVGVDATVRATDFVGVGAADAWLVVVDGAAAGRLEGVVGVVGAVLGSKDAVEARPLRSESSFFRCGD